MTEQDSKIFLSISHFYSTLECAHPFQSQCPPSQCVGCGGETEKVFRLRKNTLIMFYQPHWEGIVVE